MIMAVLERRSAVPLSRNDAYTSTVGGVRLNEPGTDLAVALAVAGSVCERPLATGTVVIGELGLAGEVRRVPGTGRRMNEAFRLGFTRAIIPSGTDDAMPDGMVVREVPTITEALKVAFGVDASDRLRPAPQQVHPDGRP
jgi:DNA repair protein RadA/Sms